MNYGEERFIKVYTRDEADWLALPLEAQGVLLLLKRKADRAGGLPVGRLGLKGIPAVLGHAHRADVVMAAVDALVAGGFLQADDASCHVVGFREEQETPQTDTARKRRQREFGAEQNPVTPGRAMSREVTPAHEPSRHVPPRLDETRRDETTTASQSAPAVAAPPSVERPVLALEPTDLPRPKGKSEAHALHDALCFARAGLFDLPDKGLPAAAVNGKFGPLIAQWGAPALREAHRQFLADPWAQSLDPPCPLNAFVGKIDKYLSMAKRGGPVTASRGRADLSKIDYGQPGDPDAIR